MTAELFDEFPALEDAHLCLASGAALLRGFARQKDVQLLQSFEEVIARAPLRHCITPGGYTMSVAMTNSGSLGWVSSLGGYKYERCDPLSGEPWPVMPTTWLELATSAAAQAGFSDFKPDACLINVYEPGSKLSLHQDKDEKDMTAPIVSVSLGLPAVFLFGGLRRSDKPQQLRLCHGDVVVWGGPARLAYHGVKPLADGEHALTGRRRINLTFRKASAMTSSLNLMLASKSPGTCRVSLQS